MAAKLVRASSKKGRQANVRYDWSRQILHACLASDGRVDNEKGVFVQVNEEGVVFTIITGGDLIYDRMSYDGCCTSRKTMTLVQQDC